MMPYLIALIFILVYLLVVSYLRESRLEKGYNLLRDELMRLAIDGRYSNPEASILNEKLKKERAVR